MTRRNPPPAVDLMTGEGCDELREATERALQNPGQPVTAGIWTVTCHDGGKRSIECNGGPDPAEMPVWNLP